MDGKLLYSVEEAAALLGLGRTLTYELMRAGELRSVVVGRRRLISAAALAEYVRDLESAAGGR